MKIKFILSWAFMFISVFVFSQHTKNVLIYNTTSTGCGPCSCMDSMFTNVIWPAHPNTIVVAFHSIDSDFKEYPGNCIVDAFKKTSEIEPSCFPDGIGYDVDYLQIKHVVDSLYQKSPETPIDIELTSKQFDPDSRWLNLDIRIQNDGPQLHGYYRYNVMVIEDNVLAWHSSWPNCAPAHIPPGLDTTFMNRAVTRNILYCANGAPINEELNWPEQNEIQFTSKVYLKPEWFVDNCQVIVNVYKYDKEYLLYQFPVLQAIREPIIGSSTTPENYGDYSILRVYPNPATATANLHIALSKASLCSVDVYDLNGNKLKSLLKKKLTAGKYNIELNTAQLTPGTYLIMLETEQGKTSKKLIVL